MAKRKTKRKQIVAWAVDAPEWWWVFPLYDNALDKADAVGERTGKRPRVARLREVTPAEEAVLRAAVRMVRRQIVLPSSPEWLALTRAVERMEKER
jgi:hypothetical protein